MNFRKGLEEVDKAIINIRVAVIIFAIVQPVVNGKFSTRLGLIAFLHFYFYLLQVFGLSLMEEIEMSYKQYLVFITVGIIITAVSLFAFTTWMERRKENSKLGK